MMIVIYRNKPYNLVKAVADKNTAFIRAVDGKSEVIDVDLDKLEYPPEKEPGETYVKLLGKGDNMPKISFESMDFLDRILSCQSCLDSIYYEAGYYMTVDFEDGWQLKMKLDLVEPKTDEEENE